MMSIMQSKIAAVKTVNTLLKRHETRCAIISFNNCKASHLFLKALHNSLWLKHSLCSQNLVEFVQSMMNISKYQKILLNKRLSLNKPDEVNNFKIVVHKDLKESLLGCVLVLRMNRTLTWQT